MKKMTMVLFIFHKCKRRTAEVNYNSCQRREGQNYRTALYQLYMNTTMADFFCNFAVPIPSDSDGLTVSGQIHETFSQSSSDLLEQTIQTVRQEVLMDSAISSTNKNKEIIFRLYQQGIFNLKDAVVTIAEALGISKNTVYLHLRNLEKVNN